MKKILLLLLIFIIPLNIFAKDANITPNAKSAILIEASTGKILYNKNANSTSSVASLTKMMGLIIIMEKLEDGSITKDEVLTISKNAKETGGSQIWLEEGEKISVDDLLKGITMASANDAMVALAERISGTEEDFVKLMNQKVKEYGLKNTNFKNVTGFDEEGHFSSAYDMSIIAMHLLEHEDILSYTSKYEDYIRENTDNKTWIVNTNKLVRFYDGADGLKTGYTENAGSCMAVTSLKNDLRLIAITLGYSDAKVRNNEASALLDYGYNQYKTNIIFKKTDTIGKVNLEKASRNSVTFYPEKDIVSINKKGEKDIKVSYKININEINYPIKKGDKLGTIEITENGKVTNNINLLSNQSAKKLNIFSLYLKTLKNVLSGN